MARGPTRRPAAATFAALLLAAALCATTQAATPSQSPAQAVCAGSFQVLHDDRIGALRLSAGAYRITVANPQRLSCAKATQDLSEFVSDYDGKIRRPWTLDADQSTFQRGSDAGVAFQLARIGPPGSGGGPTSHACPGFFRVRHDDHIGTLSLPKGAYRVTLTSSKPLSCAAATRRLTAFLQDFDGRLSKPWTLENATATFTRGAGSATGFRIKPAVGRESKPGSGGRYPANGQPGKCPGSFGVLHRDRIGRAVVPAGPYLTFAVRGSGLTCSELAGLFRRFLARSATPGSYGLNPATGTFLNRGRAIFRVKPASPKVTTEPASR